MKITHVILTIIVVKFGSSQKIFSQENVRDTSLFNEHQVKFEQMDYISHIRGLKILRIYKNDSSQLVIHGDPYWISCLVTNEEYSDYLNSIKSDSTMDVYNKAIPKKDLLNQKIEWLGISLSEYFSNIQYKYYPVLGINWYQANDYCIWKTNMVNMELQQVNLPKEKRYRLPKQAEIEYSKKFVNINLPGIAKIDSTFDSNEIIEFCKKINEWTGEGFISETYLTALSDEKDSENIVIYRKDNQVNTFENKGKGRLNIGFRFVQTYRKVPDAQGGLISFF